MKNQMKTVIMTFLLSVYCYQAFLFAESPTTPAKAVTTISFGEYRTGDGKSTILGTQISLERSVVFQDQWAYFWGLNSASASGEYVAKNGSVIVITSKTTTISGGIKRTFPIDDFSRLLPFIGAGMSIQNYKYQFSYPESDIGDTAGIGMGPTLNAGIRIELFKRFIMIPGYNFSQIFIHSEKSELYAVTSSGFSLALIFRF